MNRRGFLQALFAVPVIAAPLLIPKSVQAAPGQWVITSVDRDRGIATASRLPKTYAGKVEYLADLVEAGYIDRPTAARMLRSSCPDLGYA